MAEDSETTVTGEEDPNEVEEMEFDESTTRAEFNRELDRFAEEHAAMTAPEMARAFAAHLPRQNVDLVQRMIAASAYALLAARFRSRFSQIRNRVFATLDIPSSNPANPPRRLMTVAEKIEKWREFIPKKGHKLLLEMTMAEVNLAFEARTRRMLAEAWRAEVLRRIYDQRDTDDQLVADKFSAEEIRNIVQATRTAMYQGNLRIAIKAVPRSEPPPPRSRRRKDT